MDKIRTILFIIAAIVLSGCQSLSATPELQDKERQAPEAQDQSSASGIESKDPLAELVNTYWKLTHLDGFPVEMKEGQTREAHLQLMLKDNKVRGFGACNNFAGSFILNTGILNDNISNGNELSFGPLMSTRKFCHSVMDIETDFLQALRDTAYYSITKEKLTLFSESKEPLADFQAIYF